MSWLHPFEPRERVGDIDASDREGNKDMTRQEFRKDSDINELLGRMETQGLIANFSRFGPDWAESNVEFPGSFQEAMALILEAQEDFMKLPSRARAEFANDPGAYLDFMSNPDNYERAVELGILPAPPGPAEQKAAQAAPANEPAGEKSENAADSDPPAA